MNTFSYSGPTYNVKVILKTGEEFEREVICADDFAASVHKNGFWFSDPEGRHWVPASTVKRIDFIGEA